MKLFLYFSLGQIGRGIAGLLIAFVTSTFVSASDSIYRYYTAAEFASNPIGIYVGVPRDNGDLYCPQKTADSLNAQIRNLRQLGMKLSDQQVEAISERCGLTGDENAVLLKIDSSEELSCMLAAANTLYLPEGDLVLLMPEKRYSIYEGTYFIREGKNITLCGINDLIESPDDIKPDSRYLINNKPVNIPPHEYLTHLEVKPSQYRSNGDGISNYTNTGELTISGLAMSNLKYHSDFLFSLFGKPSFTLKNSYLDIPSGLIASSGGWSSITIIDSIIKNSSGYMLWLASPKSLVIKNSLFHMLPVGSLRMYKEWVLGNKVLDISPAYSKTDLRVMDSAFQSTDRINENTALFFQQSTPALIRNVEFGSGIDVPISVWAATAQANSTGNTWLNYTGLISKGPCKGPIKSGYFEFQDGIRCAKTVDPLSQPATQYTDQTEQAKSSVNSTLRPELLLLLLTLVPVL